MLYAGPVVCWLCLTAVLGSASYGIPDLYLIYLVLSHRLLLKKISK